MADKPLNLITFFLQIQDQLQVLHWQTKSYAQHMAFGRVYDALGGLVDSFIEAYQGRHGRIKVGGSIVVSDFEELEAGKFADEVIAALKTDITSMIDPKDTDLLNIRDSMLEQFQTLKYLLTLQ